MAGVSGAVRIAAGHSHTLITLEDGTALAAGYNSHGQLGDRTNENRSSPVIVPIAGTIVDVAATSYGSLFLRSDGAVLGVGYNLSGETGDTSVAAADIRPTVLNYFPPVILAEPGDVTAYAAEEAVFQIDAFADPEASYQWRRRPANSHEWQDLTDNAVISGARTDTLRINDVSPGMNGDTFHCVVSNGIEPRTTSAYAELSVIDLSILSEDELWRAYRTLPYENRIVARGGHAPFTWEIIDGELPEGIFLDPDGRLHGATNTHVPSHFTLRVTDADGNTATKEFFLQTAGFTPQIAVGTSHSLSLKSSGTVWASGGNMRGQLGDGSHDDRLMPVSPDLPGPVVGIAAGLDHSLFLLSDGRVFAAGANDRGQLGNGTQEDSALPLEVADLSDVVAVAAGPDHSLFLKSDRTVWGAGSNFRRQLGRQTSNAPQTAPVPIEGISNIKAIAAGAELSLFLRADGTVWGVGSNQGGQIGDGTFHNRLDPVQTVGMEDVVAISTGGVHSLFLRADGSVWATGDGGFAQLAGHSENRVHTPFRLPVETAVRAAFATSSRATALVTVDGELLMSQSRYAGDTDEFLQPVSGLQGVASIATGTNHSLFLLETGQIFASGWNAPFQYTMDIPGQGLFGDGTVTNHRKVAARIDGLEDIVAVSAGRRHNLMLHTDGTVWGTGSNQSSALGPADLFLAKTPISVEGISEVVAISAGNNHSLFLKSDNTVWGVGANFRNQVSPESVNILDTPVRIENLPPIAKIAAGGEHSMFLDSSGTVWVVGSNRYGQLGTGHSTNVIYPVAITSLENVVDIATYEDHSLFLLQDGTVWTSGRNQRGQLGRDNSNPGIAPAKVAAPENVHFIGSGRDHSFFIQSDGSLWGTGYNLHGTLGIPNAPSSVQVPTRVPLDLAGDIVMINGGANHSLALDSSGYVYAAGRNEFGQLGDGTTFPSQTFSKVSGLENVIALSVKFNHAVFLHEDGTVSATGHNDYGQLGTGSLSNHEFIESYLGSREPQLGIVEQWRADHGLPIDGKSFGDDFADPDGDGIPNLLERAFGGDPLHADDSVLPVISVSFDSGNELATLTYRRRINGHLTDKGYEVDGLRYTVLYSLDAENWERASELTMPPAEPDQPAAGIEFGEASISYSPHPYNQVILMQVVIEPYEINDP